MEIQHCFEYLKRNENIIKIIYVIIHLMSVLNSIRS